MKAMGLICARGGSKGLPGKNIRSLKGKPLIGYAIENALSISRIKKLIVSTDSEDIAEVARDFNAEVPFLRPAALAQDDSPEWMVWRHALEYYLENEKQLPDALVSVPATAPLRKSIDIEKCIDRFSEGDVDIVVTMTDAYRNPYFNMVVKSGEEGFLDLAIRPDKIISRRQDAPTVYDLTTVAYVASPEFVLKESNLFAGRVAGVIVPQERALDIDTEMDWQIAECLMNRENLL